MNYSKKTLIGIVLLFTMILCVSSVSYAATAKVTGSDLTLNAGESTTLTVYVKDSNNNPLKGKLVVLRVQNSIELFDTQTANTDSSGSVRFKVTAPKSAGTYSLSYELGLFDSDGKSNQYSGTKGSNTLTVKQSAAGTTSTNFNSQNSNNNGNSGNSGNSGVLLDLTTSYTSSGEKEVFHKKISKYSHTGNEFYKKKNLRTSKIKKIGKYKYRAYKLYYYYKKYKYYTNYNQYKVYKQNPDGTYKYAGLRNKKVVMETFYSSPTSKKYIGTTKKHIGTQYIRIR